jgi:dihydrofolate reductase
MARVQYMAAATLDGFIADPDGGLQWLFDAAGNPTEGEPAEDFESFMKGVTAIVMGAATYEFILGEDIPWPHGDTPTWVFANRERPGFDGADLRFVSGPPADHADAMLAAAGDGVLWLVGGGKLASGFVDDGLLDELLVSVVPVWLGEGIPLFARPLPAQLRLERSREQFRGLVELAYAVPKKP